MRRPPSAPGNQMKVSRGQIGGSRAAKWITGIPWGSDRLGYGFRVLQEREEEQMLPPSSFFLSQLVPFVL